MAYLRIVGRCDRVYHVLDVCRHAINYSNEKDYGISNLKLQKILYFIQAYFLISTPDPCFEESIEAWDLGPVVPQAYREYKRYGSSDIPFIFSYVVLDGKDIWNSTSVAYEDNVVSVQDKVLMNSVIDKFKDYSATDLVSLTHHQAPWKDAYSRGRNSIIDIRSIKEYFNGK